MGQAPPGGAEVGVGRGVEEVRHPAGVDVCIALDLPREVALVVAGTGEQAPARVRELSARLGQGRDLGVQGQQHQGCAPAEGALASRARRTGDQGFAWGLFLVTPVGASRCHLTSQKMVSFALSVKDNSGKRSGDGNS